MINSKFRKTIQKQRLINNNERILLAVSGGMDSMTMVYLFMSIYQPIGIAHIDHQLRGHESDQDRLFVEKFARDNSIPFYCKRIDIKALTEGSSQSKSEIGRKQRYAFFNEICRQHKYTKIATAHHLDDRIETFLMRAMTGSGLEGLSSIPYKNEHIIRPLLDISRSEIESFVKENNIQYRVDSSNAQTEYLRNSIRHQLIPALEKVMPSYKKSIANTIENIGDSHRLIKSLLDDADDKSLEDGSIEISIPENSDGRLTYLHYRLKDFGFSRTQLKNIIEGDHSGAVIQNDGHELLRNRDKLILRRKGIENTLKLEYSITEVGETIMLNGDMLCIYKTNETTHSTDAFTELVDADKLTFPLTLRKWKEGDSIKPLGMDGRSQTLQDFFTNKKLSVFEKQNVWLLSSHDTVFWIIGYRINHEIRLTNNTKNTFRLEFKKAWTMEKEGRV